MSSHFEHLDWTFDTSFDDHVQKYERIGNNRTNDSIDIDWTKIVEITELSDSRDARKGIVVVPHKLSQYGQRRMSKTIGCL